MTSTASSTPSRKPAVFCSLPDIAPDYDWTVTWLTFQGIVNRSGPSLLYHGVKLNDWKEADPLWRQIYSEERGFEFEEIHDADGLLKKFRRRLKGCVIYDETFDATKWLAVTLGGLENLLPLTESQRKSLRVKLPIKHDLRGRFTSREEACDWGLANLMPRTNRGYAFNAGYSHDEIQMGWDFGVVGALDYVVMQKGYAMNYSPAEGPGEFYGEKVPGYPAQTAMFRKCLDQLEAPAQVYGWAEPEWTFTEFVNQSGHLVMCGHESNLSFHRQASTRTRRFKQNKPARKLKLENKTYIAFLTSEGDTPRMVTSFFYGAWLDENRGALPINWGTNPMFPEEFPVLAEYYYRTAGENDYFFSGVGGCGYVFPSFVKDFDRFLEWAAPHFKRADIDIIDIWEKGEDIKYEQLVPYAEKCGLKAITYLPRETGTDYEWLPNGTALIFQYKPIHYFKEDAEEMAKRTREVAAERPGPRFLVLYNSPPHDAPSYYKAIYEKLDPEQFVAVRLDEMVELMRRLRR